MAGFVGNHECVAVINNYVGKEEVYFYTRKQPLETEPKLSLQLAKPIHQLVQTVRISPNTVALFHRLSVFLPTTVLFMHFYQFCKNKISAKNLC